MTRAIKAFAALALAGTSILCATSQASADPNPNNTGSNPQGTDQAGRPGPRGRLHVPRRGM